MHNNPKEYIQRIIEAKKAPRLKKIGDLLIQIDRLKAQIEAQKQELRVELLETFEELEKEIEKLPSPQKQQALEVLQSYKLSSLEFLGILAETTESAILTTLENGENIQETITEITKDLTYQTIDINVDPKHIKDVSTTILGVAASISEASINYADEILQGAIGGVKQGIQKSLMKFNETIQFTPDEARTLIIQNYEDIEANLGRIDEIYLEAIQEVANKSEPGIKEKILSIAQESILTKLKSEAQKALHTLKRSFEDILKETSHIKLSTTEAKKLGLRAFEIAKEKLQESLNAIKK